LLLCQILEIFIKNKYQVIICSHILKIYFEKNTKAKRPSFIVLSTFITNIKKRSIYEKNGNDSSEFHLPYELQCKL
jgi:hypothetical protein